MKNEVNGCLGCNACRYGKPCIQKDSFNNLVPKIEAADLIVFATPLHFWTNLWVLMRGSEKFMRQGCRGELSFFEGRGSPDFLCCRNAVQIGL